ncbi:sigma-70 family RNA polymerase sigma factor [Candidatus Woesearchaeota archaeon]|nr:sigma-70 family RNA polymerase sigma factor [Candidatus Woesearchaeota archaeon]
MIKEDLATMVNRARSGDQRAFDELYIAVQPEIMNYVLKRLRAEPYIAEDIAHEAMKTAFRKLDKLRTPQAFPYWVHRIAINMYKNYMRTQKRLKYAITVSLSDGLENIAELVPDTRQGSDNTATYNELRAHVVRALEGMPSIYRKTIIADGHTHAESAALLNLKLDAFKTRLHRARAMLSTELRRHYPEEYIPV